MAVAAIHDTSSDKIMPLEGGIGARANFDITRPLSDEDRQAIADAFHAHRILIFDDVQLSLEEMANFVSNFGVSDTGGGQLASDVAKHAGIRIVENVEKGKFGPRSNSELDWHSDRFYNPVVAGILNSWIVPEEGGDTSFVDMRAVYKALPADLKEAIKGRTIRQDCIFSPEGMPMMRPGGTKIDDLVNAEGIETPIVQTCRYSGQKFLYLGNRLNAYIPSLPLAESEALLDRLYDFANESKALQYRHKWSPRQLILYDNRACMHRRETFDVNADRKLVASVVDQSYVL